MSNFLLETVREQLKETRSPEEALEAAFEIIGHEVERRVQIRQPFSHALMSLGFDPDAAEQIEQASFSLGVRFALRTVVTGGGAAGVPTAECLSRHLPPDGRWTDEEMDAAVEACRRESAKVARLA
jgi:hypothetical protein